MASSSTNLATRVKHDLKLVAEERRLGPKPPCTMFLVRQGLRNANPDHYIPKEISLGLFNRSPLDAPKTIADKIRLEIACTFLRVSGMNEGNDNDWDKLCNEVVPNPKEMRDLYYGVEDSLSDEDVASVLTLDAIFIACLVTNFYFSSLDMYFPAFKGLIPADETVTGERILMDILNVENQVPLTLIGNALDVLFNKRIGELPRRSPGETDIAHSTLVSICTRMAEYLQYHIPGYDDQESSSDTREGVSHNFAEYNSVLDFAYRWQLRHDVRLPGFERSFNRSSCIEMVDLPASTENFVTSLPSVTRLHGAGITFQGFKGTFHDIKFSPGRFKGVLHLPILYINAGTERAWRNLVAFEQLQWIGGVKKWDQSCELVCYFSFMNHLIDDGNDVLLLTKGKNPVIRANWMGDNKTVALIFNTMVKDCAMADSPKWILLKRQILDYYSEVHRRTYVEFMQTNFGKPWFIFSILGALILLIATILQTVFTVLGYFFK